MPHPSWEDLSAFFDADDFATSAVVNRGDEKVAEVLGIFEDPNDPASLGEYELDHDGPTFLCSEVLVAAVNKDDVLVVADGDGSKTFDVMREPQRDGTGLSVLYLGKPNVVFNAGL